MGRDECLWVLLMTLVVFKPSAYSTNVFSLNCLSVVQNESSTAQELGRRGSVSM